MPDEECYKKMKELIYTLPYPRIVVMRYLFAFLNHLSQYSDENLMYAYNLAVCFGPALLPIPDNKDQVNIRRNYYEMNFSVVCYTPHEPTKPSDKLWPHKPICNVVMDLINK